MILSQSLFQNLLTLINLVSDLFKCSYFYWFCRDACRIYEDVGIAPTFLPRLVRLWCEKTYECLSCYRTILIQLRPRSEGSTRNVFFLVYGTITESVRIYIVARTRHCRYAHDIDERSSDLLEWFSRRSVRSEPVPIVFDLFSRGPFHQKAYACRNSTTVVNIVLIQSVLLMSVSSKGVT